MTSLFAHMRSFLLVLFGALVLSIFVCLSASAQGTVIGQGSFQRDPYEPSDAKLTVKEETLEEKVSRLRRELQMAEDELIASKEGVGKHSKSLLKSERNKLPTSALVVIASENGSGSGFIAEIKERRFLVTNIHVLGAARGAEFTTIDGVDLALGKVAFLSKNRDIAIVPVEWDGDVFNLSPSLRFDEVSIGQKITVMGNSSGASVATSLSGVIKGIGPDELEVSAKFVPGNSGSPIVHDELGTVVAIASHLKDFSSDSKWTEDSDFNEVRRFGFRLDGEIIWEQVELSKLFEECERYTEFEERTVAMWNISYMLTYESKLLTSYRGHGSIGHLYEDINSEFNWDRGTESAHNKQMLGRFVNGMMIEVQSDLAETKKNLTVSYFKNRYAEIGGFRSVILNNLSRFANSRL